MKPTSLSQEFYKNLYNEIINADDTNCDCNEDGDYVCNLEFEIEGLQVSLTAVFESVFVDDSFDHAFGTEYGYHYETGNFIDLDEVCIYDDDDNDLSDLFDEETFWEQDKEYGIKFRSGTEIKPGDEVMYQYNRKWYKGVYQYTKKQSGDHVCLKENGRLGVYDRVVTIAAYERAYERAMSK